VRFFPEARFSTAKGATATLDYEKLLLSEWQTPLLFSTIIRCRLDQSLGRHKLIIDYHLEGNAKPQTHKISFKDFKRDGADFLKTFEMYYGRHMTAKKYHAQKAAPIPAQLETAIT
jgi:hypothetical protein